MLHIPRQIFLLGFAIAALAACSPAAAPTPSAAPPTELPTEAAAATEPPTESASPTEAPTLEATVTPAAAPVGDGTWSEAPELLNARAAHAVVSTGDAIYVMAGTTASGPVLDVERFDGSAWTTETTLPGDGINAPAAAVLDNKIYLIGGFKTTTNLPTDEVKIYDITTKEWSDAAPLPEPRGGHAAVVVDGKIHVVGGGNSRSTLANHSEYDPATNTWRDLAPLPRSEGSPAAVDVNGTLYVIGGRSGPEDFGDAYIYDAAADSWSTGPEIEPRGTSGAVFYCGAIYLFGGESQAKHKNLADVLRLGPSRDAWEAMSPMPHARNFARTVLFGDSVYVVGGGLSPQTSHSPGGSTFVETFTVADCGS